MEIEAIVSSKRTMQEMLSVLGLIFFLLTCSVYFFFRHYGFSALLTVLFFVLSLLFSWSAVALLKHTKESGVVEMLSWSIALLDSILAIALILMFLSGSSLFLIS